jgi:hypothetical protein
MSIDAMKQALEAMEEIHRTGDTQLFDLCYAPKVIPALRLAIEQAERQEPGLEPSDMPDGENPMYDHPFFIEGMVWANNKLLEKNAAQRQRQPLTDEDWAQIWADFEDTDVENDFQDYMVEKYGPGYYVDADGMYWIFQQQVIRRIVDSKLAGEKK